MLRFYAGKGGAGKTTCAAAAALALARAGRRTLVLSTDPAHSLGDALALRLSAAPRKVRGTLFAAEMDADRALSRWLSARERKLRTLAGRGTWLDEEDVDALFRLSLPGVDELIGLTEIRRLARSFEEVVVDTAPTGHTLRLLSMPATLEKLARVLDDLQAKHRAMARSLRGVVRRDAEDALIEELEEEARSLQRLLRSEEAEFHWVTAAEDLALEEARDGVEALRREKLRPVRLIANRLTPAPEGKCELCAGRRAEEARVLRQARGLRLAIFAVPEQAREPRGLPALAAVAKAIAAPARLPPPRAGRKRSAAPASRGKEIESLAPDGVRVLFFGGKGGVGKTTAAAASALCIAKGGHKVLLLSTDPAHSLADALEVPLDDEEREVAKGLFARELDAAQAFRGRRERYLEAVEELFSSLRGGASFDAPYDRAVMNDLIDLAPPGLDELFALFAISESLPRYRVLVVDTAPTGHTLRLLSLLAKAREWVQALLRIQLKYRRVTGLGELAQDLADTARELRELEELLRDPARARFIAVTRPAALPRLETRRLLASLRKLGIFCPFLLVNALTPPGCNRCRRAAAAEKKEIGELRAMGGGWAMLGAERTAPAPRGAPALERFCRSWTRME